MQFFDDGSHLMVKKLKKKNKRIDSEGYSLYISRYLATPELSNAVSAFLWVYCGSLSGRKSAAWDVAKFLLAQTKFPQEFVWILLDFLKGLFMIYFTESERGRKHNRLFSRVLGGENLAAFKYSYDVSRNMAVSPSVRWTAEYFKKCRTFRNDHTRIRVFICPTGAVIFSKRGT